MSRSGESGGAGRSGVTGPVCSSLTGRSYPGGGGRHARSPSQGYTLFEVSRIPSSSLARLSRIALAEGTLDAALEQIADIAKETLPGAEEVSITLVRDEKPFTAAYTGKLALDADELQYERGYGPCMDAGRAGTVLLVDDMRAEKRWPDYAAHVVPRGVLSSLSVPLPVQTDLIGALNIYARRPHAFDSRAVDVAKELASYVAVAVGNAAAYSEATKFARDMAAAMASRAVIEQAKGVIMAQNRCDPERAFEILRTASQGRNVKLRDIAREIVATVAGKPWSESG
jgi:transcriptional regulator with GAF, ATPase, and Fis domain